MLTSNVQLAYLLARGGGQAVKVVYLAPHPSVKDNRTEHLSLTERMFPSLTTKYSKLMVQYVLTDDTVWPMSWGGGRGGQDKPSWTACPHPSDKGKPLEQLILIQVPLEHIFIRSEKHVNIQYIANKLKTSD